MSKEQALDLLCHAVSCYVEDCISTAPKSEGYAVWKAFGIVENEVLKNEKNKNNRKSC